MSESNPKTESLFAAALAMESPEKRANYLDEACGTDRQLRAQVEELLAAYPKVERFLESPAPVATVDESARSARPGTVIGPYKLLQQIGEGGMGVVWMAEQTQPVQRKVALKVIKPGMDSRQVIARFEAERQALAMMDHVNIARVFDGGTTGAEAEAQRGGTHDSPRCASASGRPFFVMELVHGVPITKYCDDNHLTPRERLELFVPVCQAIQHAHQKGIIHRDIKPSNVMVTLYDGKPVPKVIDFGVAKATEQKLTERTLFTQYGTMVGTLEYMSPEQAEMSALGVDTRSDIYSLGVLLYELLTGSTPLTRNRMKEAAYAEILRMIKEEEPPRPSTRLSDSGEALASISAQRKTEPAKLTKLVRGELDWIVMKALEKDRNRRYETANGFAADVHRYLADEQVLACPPSLGYRFRKFARRNRGAMVAAALLLGFLLVLGVGTSWVLIDRSTRRTATAIRVEQALSESVALFKERKHPEALLAAQTAQRLLADAGGTPELGARVESWIADLSMAGRLEEARLLASGMVDQTRFDFQVTARAYAGAFRDYGIDVNALESESAVERIRGSAIREHLVAALDHWANLPIIGDQEKLRLSALVAASDDDPWRTQVRASAKQNAAALKSLATSWEVDRQSPTTLILLAHSLHALGETDVGVNLLRKTQHRHAGDFWINQELGYLSLFAKTNRPGEAMRYFSVAVALRPQSPGARWRLGNMLINRQWDTEAFAEFQEALRLKPDYAQAYEGLGRVYLFPRQDYPAAAAAFSRALEIQPDNIFALQGRIGAHTEMGAWDKALVDSSRAIRLDASNPGCWYWHAEANRGLGKKEDALAAYSKAIELKSDYHLAIRRRGQLYAEVGQRELAAADFLRIGEVAPLLGNGRANEGTILNSAIDQISRRIVQEPDSPVHWQARGALYEQMRQWENAAGDYSKAIALKLPGHGIWMSRANVYMNQAQWEKAVADYTTAISLSVDLWLAWFQRGIAQIRLNRTEQAAADFEKALELHANDPHIRYELGHAYRGLRRWDKANAEFAKAIEVKPKFDSYVIGRGQTYSQMGQLEKAIDDFSRAIALNPASDLAYSERGACRVELGRWSEAIGDFDKLVLIVPGDAQFWEYRAMAHLAKRNEKAYRSACQEMIERFQNTKEPAIAIRVVSACVAAPDAVKDATTLVAVAKVANRHNPEWNSGLLAAALLRAGQGAAAIETMQKAPEFANRPGGLLIQALAHGQLGHEREAHELAARAEKKIAVTGRYNRRATATTIDDWQSWLEEVGVRAMLAEAKQTAGDRKPKSK